MTQYTYCLILTGLLNTSKKKNLMFLTTVLRTVLNVFMKLYHCFLLLFCLNGPFSKASDFFDGFQTWDVPCFHQVAGQHGPRPAMTMHAVNRNGLKSTKNQNQIFYENTTNLVDTYNNIIVTQTDKVCVCVCKLYTHAHTHRERERDLIWK